MSAAAVEKLRADGASAQAVAAFAAKLEQLGDPAAGLVSGDELEPVGDVPALGDLDPGGSLDGVVVIKLNGGLGTSMGLSVPKSTLVAKDGLTFLEIIGRQTRARDLPLVLMNSAATPGPSRALVDARDFLQGREPKLLADSLQPVSWPADPELEWYPPGHGELYVALVSSGMLDTLLHEGLRYAFVSNADNLGAVADPRIATWLARNDIPFAMEVVRGTPADRKGGHLALRDGRLLLRETAMVPDGDTSFGDVERWRWYNTNNLWMDLRALPAGPELPLIVNRKTVDPSDPASPAVLQLETAMGAAIGAIGGARALHVPRSRFAPVKTTDDLLVLRSDAYVLDDDGTLRPTFDAEQPPVVRLDERFQRLDDFEARFPAGPPSLRACRSLTVTGDVTFGADVVVEGDVTVTMDVPDGARLSG